MTDQPSTFPLLDPDDDVTIDGIDLLAEIGEQEKTEPEESSTTVDETDWIDDELTIDGAQLAEELLAEPPTTPTSPTSRLPGPARVQEIRPLPPKDPNRWKPPAAQGLEELPSPAPTNGKIQLTAALATVLLCLGLAAWIWEGSSGPSPHDTPPVISDEGE